MDGIVFHVGALITTLLIVVVVAGGAAWKSHSWLKAKKAPLPWLVALLVFAVVGFWTTAFFGPRIVGRVRTTPPTSAESWILPVGWTREDAKTAWDSFWASGPVADMRATRPVAILENTGREVVAMAQPAPVAAQPAAAPADQAWCPQTQQDAASWLGGTPSQWEDLKWSSGYRKWKFDSGAKGQNWSLKRPVTLDGKGHGTFDTYRGDGQAHDVSADKATFNCVGD